MPTKPVTTYTFATDAFFSSGPASGFPTKIIPGSLPQGFIPGNGINAEWPNYLFNLTGQWITDWISLGSSAAGLDAHLVETNADGMTSIAAIALGGTASLDRALTVDENSGASSAAATIDNSAPGGFGLIVSVASTVAALRSLNSGSGSAIQGLNLGTGPGGLFTGAGSGSGATLTGGASGPGLLATGNGSANGGEIRATGTGAALLIERQASATLAGLRLELAGAGVPVHGALYLEPHVNPSAPIDGEVWKTPGVSGFGRGKLRVYDADGAAGGGGGGIQTAWTTSAGLGYGYAESLTDSTEAAGANVTKVTLSLGAAASPGQPLGKYKIHFKASFRLDAGALTTTRGIIEIHGPGGLIETHYQIWSALGEDASWSTFIQDTLGVGIQSYSIRFRTNSVGRGVILSKARIIATGTFE